MYLRGVAPRIHHREQLCKCSTRITFIYDGLLTLRLIRMIFLSNSFIRNYDSRETPVRTIYQANTTHVRVRVRVRIGIRVPVYVHVSYSYTRIRTIIYIRTSERSKRAENIDD